VTDEKPLSVPRDIDLRLDTSPITAVDALGNPPCAHCSLRTRDPALPCTWDPRPCPGPPHRSPQRSDVSLHHASAALFPGVPVVRGFCRLLHCRVHLHRGLLLPGGPPEGDQHRGALVPADSRLLRVSFRQLSGCDCHHPPGPGCDGWEREPPPPWFFPVKSQ